MTDYMSSNTINDLLRSIFALLDRVAYWLLSLMYQILFNVAKADIFSNNLIQDFYSRIQLIIGIFMVFKLAVSIIQGIVNPDTFTDKKAGISSIITRIIFAIVLLTALTPFNIPNPSNRFEREIADNGLLFGVLYDLQGRLLEQNTLGRLILGENAATTNETQQTSLSKDADSFSVTILKTFIRINLKPGESDESDEDAWICKVDDDVRDAVKAYNNEKTDTNKILSLINASCEIDPNINNAHLNLLEKFKRLFSSDRYIFTYVPIISTIPAVILIYILLGEIITIAIRTVKLAVLRLLAPIPVISYIDPKSQKDGAFGAWVKNLTSTYLELFIHLAVLYFVIYLIQGIIKDGIVKNFGSGVVGALSFVFIIIGLFFFIKQAPKFIKDVLGVKGGGSNVGLATMLGGAAMVAGGGGAKGFALGAMQGADMAAQAASQGKEAPLGAVWKQNSDKMAQIRTGDKDAHGGMLGTAMDHMNYSLRDRMASRLGLSKANVDKAEEDMIAAKNLLRDKKNALSRYEQDIKDPNTGINYDQTTYDRLLAEVNAAEDNFEAKQRVYQKGDDTRSKNFGVSNRPIDKWGVSDRTTLEDRTKYHRGVQESGGYSARRKRNFTTATENVKTTFGNAGEFISSAGGYKRKPEYGEYENLDTFRNSRAYPGNSSSSGAIDDQDISSRGGSGTGGGPGPGGHH